MGLFSMFKKKNDNYSPAHAKKESPAPARKTTVVEPREYVRECSIIGDEEYTVYTYDAAPLKGVKTGQNIWLELTCDVTMPERAFKPGDENLTITIKKDPEHPRQKEHVFIDFLGKPFINIPATYGCYYPIVNQAYRPIKHAGFRRELTNTGYQYNVVFWFEHIDLN